MTVGNDNQIAWQIQLSDLHTQVRTNPCGLSRGESELEPFDPLRVGSLIQRRADPDLPADIRRRRDHATAAATPEKLRPLGVSG